MHSSHSGCQARYVPMNLMADCVCVCVVCRSIEEIRRMMHLGYEYAAKLNAEGRFSEYCLAEVLLQVR